MSDEPPTKPQTPVSRQFAPVECPLCLHQDMWRGAPVCPGCNRAPETILEEGVGAISRFKIPGLFALYPELARVDTLREMMAVQPPEKEPKT
jgi:hypothetical protein